MPARIVEIFWTHRQMNRQTAKGQTGMEVEIVI